MPENWNQLRWAAAHAIPDARPAIRVVGNLSQVDKSGRIKRLLPRLIGFLNSGKLITANNTIMSLTQVAKSKPELREDILAQFLKVERYCYESDEYRKTPSSA